MTTHKHLKRRVRERMADTGERYSAARRHVADRVDADTAGAAPGTRTPRRVPGAVTRAIHPETAALHAALAAIAVTDPHTGQPWTEEMLLGLGGGIGIGVFAFHYAAEDFSSFFLGARHLWDDSAAFITSAARRVGARADVLETSSARTAAAELLDVLADGAAAIASVDVEALGYRGVPAELSGGGYHVVVVRAMHAERGTVEIEDLRPGWIEVPHDVFARARARIRSQKHRLVAIRPPGPDAPTPAIAAAIRDALRAAGDGLEGLLDPAAGGRRGRNFSLDGLSTWATRLHGDQSPEGWERVFPRGHRLWRGLSSIAEFVDHAGTGGGLLRPMYARFLHEAAARVELPDLHEVAARYEALGGEWRALASAALPDDVPVFAETKQLLQRREDLYFERGADATGELRGIWARLGAIETEMRESFPLTDAQVDVLLADLQSRVRSLETNERAAARSLRSVAAAVGGRVE